MRSSVQLHEHPFHYLCREGYITVEGNAGDRNNLNAWHNGVRAIPSLGYFRLTDHTHPKDTLVETVAGVNNNTIVVVNTVGPIIVEAWIDHPNVTALVRESEIIGTTLITGY